MLDVEKTKVSETERKVGMNEKWSSLVNGSVERKLRTGSEGSNEIVWWRSMKFPVSETGIQAVSK
jgi:hypothetical protein